MSTPRSPRWLLAALLVLGVAAHAADDASERRRIERERAEVDARARAGEAACAERFAVSSCLAQVRAERRAATQQLEHQRALLDDAQRKRRAADRQARIRERQDATARADESRQPPPATRPLPAAAAPAPASASAAESGTAAPSSAHRRSAAAAASETAAAARRAAAAKRRAEQAAAHRQAVEQRNRERDPKRPPAQALPVPATPAASAAPVR